MPFALFLLLLFLIAVFLWGGISPGLLLMRFRGINIREQGSGNIGATNVMRIGGKKVGIATFVLDAFKGFAPVWYVMHEKPELIKLTAIAVIAGHIFSPWLGFKGGKGMSTFMGVLLALSPMACLAGALAWIVTLYAVGYVSLATLVGTSVALYGLWWMDASTLALDLTLFCLIVFAHRENIARLLRGTEPLIQSKKKKDH